MMRIWAKDQPFGAELADVNIGSGTLSASGVTLGIDPTPYHLEYRLSATDGYMNDDATRRSHAGR
jgi:hypothetical protein